MLPLPLRIGTAPSCIWSWPTNALISVQLTSITTFRSAHDVIFWFSPLTWWLQKELADLGEAISDHEAIMQAPDRCSYPNYSWNLLGGIVGLWLASRDRRGGINRRVERILNDTLFRCAFMGRKRHVFVAVAFSVALLVSTSHFVVRAAGGSRSHSSYRTRNRPKNIHGIAGFGVIRSQHCQP